MKKRLCLLLALLLTLGTAPALAMANNPAGTTVQEVPEEETMESNAGTVIENNGQITENSGVVTTNNGIVSDNENIVSQNNGQVEFNAGIVTTSSEDAHVGLNEVDAIVTFNEGSLETNDGIVSFNGSTGSIEENNATVTKNKEGGEIGTNNGDITVNSGNLSTNTVAGTVTTATSTSYITDNDGQIDENAGTVYNNAGTVSENTGEVIYNTGDVVLAEGGTVKNNMGLVTNGNYVCNDPSTMDLYIEYGTNTYLGMYYCMDLTAGYEDDIFQFTFMTDQWNLTEDGVYVIPSWYDEKINFGSHPTRCLFTHWVDADGNVYNVGDTYNGSESLRLEAVWEETYLLLPAVENEDGSFTLRGGELESLLRVIVDGEEIDRDCYTPEMDTTASTRVTFTDEYLATLSAGEHQVKVVFTYGYGEFTFTR